jgi:predicted nucleic acid-binding protein
VIDASVAIKWFVPEAETGAAKRYLDPGETLLAPELLLIEFASVALKKVRLEEITADEAAAMLAKLLRVRITLAAHSPLVEPAARWGLAYGQSAYDCLYLALAVTNRCRMVTADKRFCNAIKRTPLAGHIALIGDAA